MSQNNSHELEKFLGIAAAIAAVIAVPISLVQPELRCFIGFDSESCSKRVSLESEVGADYRKLEEFLKAGDLEKADRETTQMILWVADRQPEKSLTEQDWENFPCKDFRTIDRLWQTHSKERFGFSVQNSIWENVGKNPQEFKRHIGWSEQEKVKSDDLRAEKGYFPMNFQTLDRTLFGFNEAPYARWDKCESN